MLLLLSEFNKCGFAVSSNGTAYTPNFTKIIYISVSQTFLLTGPLWLKK